MKINLKTNPEEIINKELLGKTAVVFDILRATSTIVTVLANGCRTVVPVITVEEALSYPRNEDIILGGERNSLLISGFHHGNSPLEYTPDIVKGKTLVLTTTNGTRAIRGAAEGAGQVLIGSLLNAGAVARALLRLDQDAVLVCAGTRGEFSLEDTVAAGMVILELFKLTGKVNKPEITESRHIHKTPAEDSIFLQSDLAVAAYRLALSYREEPLNILYHSLHGQKLAGMGLSADLAWCARLNHYDIVPVFREGKISI